MKVLSVNAGSSSLKFQLFEMPEETSLVSGLFERIGIDGQYTIKLNGEKIKKEVALPDHVKAVEILLEELINLGVVSNLDEIEAIGHRLVHGSDKYSDSVVITEEVMKDIDVFKELAPLHNPANLLGVEAFKKELPNVTQVGVWDTAFHQTMEPENYLYPVPYEWYTKYGVRKYGFHGTSHKYLSIEIAKLLGREDLKVITCHLGNGGSIAAIRDGKCVDTTMGFTPLAGIMMGTRCGDIDESLIPYVMKKENKDIDAILNDLNKNSGMLGISGISSDSREIEDGIAAGNERCILAQNMYVRRVVNFVSAYNTLLGGADVIVFAGGIGENSIDTRRDVLTALEPIGVKLDEERNQVRGEVRKISTDDSKIAAYVIPTDEEVMIARDAYELSNN